MLALIREKTVEHLQEARHLAQRYSEHDYAFAQRVTVWLSGVEETMASLRHPLVSLLAAERAKIFAVGDGLRESEIDQAVKNRRRVARATASLALSRVEAALRAEVENIDGRFDGNRDQIAQLVAVASGSNPIPLPQNGRSTRYLQEVWDLLGANADTRGMYGYLNASLKPADRLYLLDQVLENLLGNTNGNGVGFAHRFADLFGPLGVRTMTELLETARTGAARRKLADAAGVGPDEILSWVNRADLMRIRGVGPEYADLLERGGVGSVKSLRASDSEQLATRLEVVNDEEHLVRRVPNVATLGRWIDQATKLRLVVRP